MVFMFPSPALGLPVRVDCRLILMFAIDLFDLAFATIVAC
jgi:hypothetical protein